MSAQDIDFSNEGLERIPCNYSGESMEIGFNARFLIEMLNAINSDEVEMELSTPSRAGILRPAEKKENEDLLMLMMPVMITV
jgi:DNA polymerase-3 subunit beta